MADEDTTTPAPAGKPGRLDRQLQDLVLKAGDTSVRVEGGKVTAHVAGRPVTVKALTLTLSEGGWSLTADHEPAPAPEAPTPEKESLPAGGSPATLGPTHETAPPQRRGQRR